MSEPTLGGGPMVQPDDNTQALAHLMRDWLRAFASDAGTAVDSGIGFGAADLWVKFGGQDIHVHLQGKADHHQRGER